MVKQESYSVTLSTPTHEVAELMREYVSNHYVNGLSFTPTGGFKGQVTETVTFSIAPVTKNLTRFSALSAVSELVHKFMQYHMTLATANPTFQFSPEQGNARETGL